MVEIDSDYSDSEEATVPFGNSDLTEIPTVPEGFKDFWELVEGEEESSQLLLDSDQSQDREVTRNNEIETTAVGEGESHPVMDCDSDTDNDVCNPLPRRSGRKNKGIPPNRYGYSLNCPPLGEIV